jgi:hypothetical protein
MLAGFGLCHRSNMSAAMLDINQCEQARVRRDHRFDGIFFWRADDAHLLPPSLSGKTR